MSPRARDLLLFLHILGFTFWVGSLGATTRLLLLAGAESDGTWSTKIAGLARKLAMVADIGAALAIVAGGILLHEQNAFLKQPFFHIKLTLVVALIAIHGFVRVKAKRMSQARGTLPRFVLPAMALAVAGIVFVIVFRLPHTS